MLSPAHAEKTLYVPAATVWLGAEGQDMLRYHGFAVTSVEVDLGLRMASQFKLTIPNTFDAARREFLTARGEPALNLLKLGTRIWIHMGYGDQTGQKLLLFGYITKVGTSFAEGSSPDLEVSGQDALYKLTLGTHRRRFENQPIRTAVAAVAKDNGLELSFDGATITTTTDSNMQTDMVFLTQLADRCGSTTKQKWEFFSRPSKKLDTLHFCPRSTAPAAIATLEWGADLLSFRPIANLGDQLSRVEVYGWDEIAKKEILGEARATGGPGKEQTGAEIQRSFLSREVVRELRLPVKSKQEADELAAAELAGAISDHVSGDGETFGFPQLLPHSRIKLKGLGAKFSRSFYVTKTVHRYNSSGYRTVFTIAEQES